MEKEKKTENQKTVWQTLSGINVNEHIEKKPTKDGKELSYLSWAWAWGTLKKYYPESTYTVREWDGKPYLFDQNLGYLVQTSLTVEGVTQSMRLPVMDGANKAQKSEPYTYGKYNKVVEPATMFDINTAIMRCLTKNMALFGLGHYIYAGEDLPQTEIEERRNAQLNAIEEVTDAETIEELKAIYEAHPELQKNSAFKSAINARAKEIEG